MPERHPWKEMVGYHQQCRTAEADQKTSGSNHQNTQMELDRSHTKEGKHKHHKASLRMEPTRITEARKAKNTWRRMLTSALKNVDKI
jgi:hypothetical protein